MTGVLAAAEVMIVFVIGSLLLPDPTSAIRLLIVTFSAYVPGATSTTSPAIAAVMPWAIVMYSLPTALPTTITALSTNCSVSTSVTVSTLEPPVTRVTTTFDPLKASV